MPADAAARRTPQKVFNASDGSFAASKALDSCIATVNATFKA
jgi:hypothetical protein